MLNHIIIHGRLTKDPELRTTIGGKPVASLTVAVDRDYKTEDGRRETDFIDAVAWNKGAEHIANHYHKGSEILLSGRLQSRDLTDKQGNKRKAWEIIVDRTDFCGSKPEGAPVKVIAADFPEITGDDSEIPF